MDKGNTGNLKSTHLRKEEQACQEELQPKSPRDSTHSYFVHAGPLAKLTTRGPVRRSNSIAVNGDGKKVE